MRRILLATISTVSLSIGIANAATLTESGNITSQYVFNQLSIGDGGNQTITNPLGDFGNRNLFWIRTDVAATFNYHVDYNPTSLAHAAADVFRVDPEKNVGCQSNCFSGTHLSLQDFGVIPDPIATASGSFAMLANQLYAIQFSQYNYATDGTYDVGPATPNGTYSLSWTLLMDATYPNLMTLTNTVNYPFHFPPSVPVPAALPLFASVLAIGALFNRYRRKHAAHTRASLKNSRN